MKYLIPILVMVICLCSCKKDSSPTSTLTNDTSFTKTRWAWITGNVTANNDYLHFAGLGTSYVIHPSGYAISDSFNISKVKKLILSYSTSLTHGSIVSFINVRVNGVFSTYSLKTSTTNETVSVDIPYLYFKNGSFASIRFFFDAVIPINVSYELKAFSIVLIAD